jgi:hypothetical protein
MSIVLVGSTSGSVTLQEPAVAGTTVLTLPATTGTFITTTGGVAPSTAGNVLTSNGTAWTSAAPSGGVTTLNGQSGAITNTDYGSIGSYVIAGDSSAAIDTYYTWNRTVSGSSLIGGNNKGGGFVQTINSNTNAVCINTTTGTQSLSLSGTWRSTTFFRTNDANDIGLALWVRIS